MIRVPITYAHLYLPYTLWYPTQHIFLHARDRNFYTFVKHINVVQNRTHKSSTTNTVPTTPDSAISRTRTRVRTRSHQTWVLCTSSARASTCTNMDYCGLAARAGLSCGDRIESTLWRNHNGQYTTQTHNQEIPSSTSYIAYKPVAIRQQNARAYITQTL